MNIKRVKAFACSVGFGLLVGILSSVLAEYLGVPVPFVISGSAGVTAACILVLRSFWNKKFGV